MSISKGLTRLEATGVSRPVRPMTLMNETVGEA